MGPRDVPDEGWSEKGARWLNSLSIEDLVDLKMLKDFGVDDDEVRQKLDRLRASYEQTTGETWD